MEEFQVYCLWDKSGLEVHISNYGAKILSMLVPDARGERVDVVLGFEKIDDWLTKEQYFNAIIGRCANRIKDARFMLDGREYHLPQNNGNNSLHGGINGFNRKYWDVVSGDASHIRLHYRAADGEEGFPGNLDTYVTYRVEGKSLHIEYEATTDAPTVVNYTNHAYFNLNGEGTPSVRDHMLQVLADEFTPFDSTTCPTGEILPVDGTPMDFREPQRIGDRIDDPFFAPGRGIDNNWVLPPCTNRQPRLAAVLSTPQRTMEVWTDAPALQVYTGNFVEEHVGKSGAMYRPQNAVCLETQNIPDAINHSNFPSPVLRPGETFRSVTVYAFR